VIAFRYVGGGLVALTMIGGATIMLHAAIGTGTVITTLQGAPREVAVDAQTARAFVVTNGPGIFGISDGYISTFDTRSGALVRTVPAGGSADNNAPVAMGVDERAGRVLAVGVDGKTRVLDARSGLILRMVSLGPIATGPAALTVDAAAGRTIVVGGDHDGIGGFAILDTRSGRVLDTATLGGNAGDWPRWVAVDGRIGRAFVSRDGQGGGSAAVRMLDIMSGRVLRAVPAGGPIAVDERRGHVFILAGSAIDVLDARTGALVRAIPLSTREGVGLLTVDEATGRVFAVASPGSSGGYGQVSALDVQGGRLIHTFSTGRSLDGIVIVAVDAQRGRVYVAKESAGPEAGTIIIRSVSVLDTRDGRLVGSIATPGDVRLIAVDARTGRVIIATQAACPAPLGPGRRHNDALAQAQAFVWSLLGQPVRNTSCSPASNVTIRDATR